MKSKGLLITIVIMLLLYIGTFLILPAKNSVSFCPTKLMFGIRCPLCGLGKSFSYISHGYITRAFYTNKSVFIFYPLYLFSIYLLLVNFIKQNNIANIPGIKIINFAKNKSLLIVIVLFIFSLIIYTIDLILGHGEKFYDPARIFYNWFK